MADLQNLLDANTNRLSNWDITRPRREYVILFMARTGSSHLNELLTSAGVGDPREWLNPGFLAAQANFFGAATFADYFTRMRASFSPGGVFGHEMTIWFYEAFSREVRLEDHFNFNDASIFLFRENIIEQAVSLFFASDRNVYHKTVDGEGQNLPPVVYNPGRIRHCAEMLAGEEDRLRAFTAGHGMSPRYLSYEQLIHSEPKDVVSAVACLVDAIPDVTGITSRHLKIGNRDNEDHVRRFEAENTKWCGELHRRRQWLFDYLYDFPLL